MICVVKNGEIIKMIDEPTIPKEGEVHKSIDIDKKDLMGKIIVIDKNGELKAKPIHEVLTASAKVSNARSIMELNG